MNKMTADERENQIESASNLATAMEAVTTLEAKFADRLQKNNELGRKLVSFQANKSEPIFNWFKYREGFSKSLIEYILRTEFSGENQTIFDPFGGSGTTGFVATKKGHNAVIAELLPVGSYFIQARQIMRSLPPSMICKWCEVSSAEMEWHQFDPLVEFQHVRITDGAFSAKTTEMISRYRTWLESLDEKRRTFFDFVLFSILEEISYTRKDGQYLRWDHRSPRTKSRFSKGKIFDFDEAVLQKLQTIKSDLAGENSAQPGFFDDESDAHVEEGSLQLLTGSVFDQIYSIPKNSLDGVITSPPYCNRYDYTRTYALELAYLGTSEKEIRDLRQALLSCTVENKKKDFSHIDQVDFSDGVKAFESNDTIAETLKYLRRESELGLLNNNGIVRMVEGYFFDMSIHIAQVAKRMRSGARYVMVNDNVRYNGLSVPIDCILSELAEALGFACEKIWVLPIGKGNSSQQMKRHGRMEMRKCVYVWKKL
jgi:hypothetical protein